MIAIKPENPEARGVTKGVEELRIEARGGRETVGAKIEIGKIVEVVKQRDPTMKLIVRKIKIFKMRGVGNGGGNDTSEHVVGEEEAAEIRKRMVEILWECSGEIVVCEGYEVERGEVEDGRRKVTGEIVVEEAEVGEILKRG